MFRFFKILSISFLFLPALLVAGNGDTAKYFRANGITHYFSATGFEYADSSSTIDNSLTGFQNYLPKYNLGNVGLPISDLFYTQPQNQYGLGFNYWKNNCRNYFYTPENLKFYNTRSPFSDLFYVAGTKKEGVFKMTFSYNIKKNWNVTVNFSRIRSEGTYVQQKTLDNFLAVSSNYKSKKNRYWLLASVIYNSCRNVENGGVKNDSTFENAGVANTQISSVGMNLSLSKRSVKSKSATIKQYLNFGRKSNDTASSGSIIPGSRLVLTSSFEGESMMYEDDALTDGFYRNFYYRSDSIKTFDTTYTYKLGNELEWKRVDNGLHRGLQDMIGYSAGIKDEFVKIKQREIDTTFNNIMVNAALYNTYSNNKFWWRLSGKYVLSGYNSGDYNASIVLRKKLADSLLTVTLSGNIQSSAPDFIYNRYLSNNFKWSNNFDKTQMWRIGGDAEIKKYKFDIGADFKVYNNVLYFDNYALAREFKGQIPLFTAFVKKDFKLLNWHLNNTIIYQYVPDSMVIRVPTFVLNHSLYYENDLFKGALHLQIGAGVNYSSAYYADAYMPATGEFYLQSEKKYGNYPFIDVFLNARIKAVRVFVKVDHVNSGFMGNTYMITPHYPMNDRLFKFGISWRFWD